MKRPIVWCSALFACGIAVSTDFSVWLVLIFICCIIYTAAAYKRLCYLFLIPVFFLGMFSTYYYNKRNLESLTQYEGKNVELVFSITDCMVRKSSGGYKQYSVKTISVEGNPVSLSGKFYCSSNFSENDIVTTECRIFPISAQDTESYNNINLINDGYSFSSFSYSAEVTGQKPLGILDKIRSFRKSVIKNIKEKTDPKVFGFLSAIITGDKSNLTDFRNETFRKLGLSHIMAVSGFHVSALLGFLYLLLDILHIKRILRNIICTAFLVFLLPFMNFSPSAARAIIMGIVMLWSSTFRKDADSLSSLGFAALIILIFRPYSLKDISFILSFTAAGGIIILSPVLQEFFEKYTGRRFPTLSCVLAVHVFLIPSSIYYFGGSSLVSIPANLIFTPVFPAIMFVAVITIAFGGFIDFLPDLMNIITKVYLNAIETASLLPTGAYSFSISGKCTYALIITASLTIAFKDKMRKMFAVITLILAVFAGMNIFQIYNGNKILLANQGGVYATVVKTPETTLAAIHCDSDTKKYDISNLKYILEKNGIEDIEFFCILNYNEITENVKHSITKFYNPKFVEDITKTLADDITLKIANNEISLNGEFSIFHLGNNTKNEFSINCQAGNPDILTTYGEKSYTSYKNGFVEFTFNKNKITGMRVGK